MTGPNKPNYGKEAIGRGEFSSAVLDGVRSRGQPTELDAQPGYWMGLQIDPQTHKISAGLTPLLNALGGRLLVSELRVQIS